MDRDRKTSSNTYRGGRFLDHDNMVRQAAYNTGANVVVVLAGFGVVALYWVLESFFRPLMWAVLCGAFLHPFKYRVTKKIKSWLNGLESSGTPLAIGVFAVPIGILNTASEKLLESLKRRWQVIIAVTMVFFSLYITYHHTPFSFRELTTLLWNCVVFLSDLISRITFRWVSEG